jgi:hypothetical protein
LDEELAVAELGERANITAISDYASMSRGRVAELLKVSKIRPDKNRLYPVADAITALVAFSDAGISIGKQIGADALSSDVGDRNAHLAALASARAASEQARARKLLLECESKERRLVEREAVTKAALEFATHVRNSLLGLSAKAAHRFVGVRTAEDAERILEELIREELTALSDVDAYVLGEIAE